VSPSAIVWLIIALAWIVVLVLIAGQALRALREAKRLRSRLDTYAELPLVAVLKRAAQDAQRLERTAVLMEPLLARAHAAIAVIRRGPLPPELVAAFFRVRAELAAFRNLRAR
jgi:hypothetical protein